MFANYLIGLREGLEASLVVTILVAYLVRADYRRGLPPLWSGVGTAVALSLGFGAILSFTSSQLSFAARELFEAVASILAVALVTWMIFWMRRTARFLKGELQGKLESALAVGPLALAAVAFLAVAREGMETALFLYTNMQALGATVAPLAGAALGILTAILLAYFLYNRALSLNLSRFFTWTGAALVIIVGGVLAYGVHDLHEAGVVSVLSGTAFDISAAIPESSWYGTLLGGIFNFRPAPSWLEVVAWLGYVVPVMTMFLRPTKPAPTKTPAQERAAA